MSHSGPIRLGLNIHPTSGCGRKFMLGTLLTTDTACPLRELMNSQEEENKQSQMCASDRKQRAQAPWVHGEGVSPSEQGGQGRTHASRT